VEGIVGQSAGYIQVDSAPGQGTSIRILLPFAPEPTLKPRSGPAGRRRDKSRGRILVVEDEDPVRAVVMRTLKEAGFDVLGASNGHEALKELEEIGGAINVVLSDVVMPGMSGRQFAAELSRRYHQIPIVWMSGHTREAELQKGQVTPDEPFLNKPIAPDLLLDTLAKAMKRLTETRS
jgi:two-component system, cell cycle sensor histidine kinase and response regulator CckA